MPWGGAALLFVSESERAGLLRVGKTNVMQALEDELVWVVFLARDASASLNTRFHILCNKKNIPLYEVPSRLELSNAARGLAGLPSVCALVAANQDEADHHLIYRRSILETIRELHASLGDDNPINP